MRGRSRNMGRSGSMWTGEPVPTVQLAGRGSGLQTPSTMSRLKPWILVSTPVQTWGEPKP